MSTGKRHQIGFPTVTALKLAKEVRDRGASVRHAEGRAVNVAPRGEGDGHKVALDFHVRRSIGQNYAHSQIPQQNQGPEALSGRTKFLDVLCLSCQPAGRSLVTNHCRQRMMKQWPCATRGYSTPRHPHAGVASTASHLPRSLPTQANDSASRASKGSAGVEISGVRA